MWRRVKGTLVDAFYRVSWRRVIAVMVGLFLIVRGLDRLFLVRTMFDRIIPRNGGQFLPTFHVSPSGYGFSVGQVTFWIELVLLLPAGILLVWTLSRWAAVVGIVAILVGAVISLSLRVLVSVFGGPPLTELVGIGELVVGLGVVVGLPALGTAFAWRDLR
ncbi:MAG: hypothetical protein ACE5IB_01255 [Candidatus Geothermarchaeales archaeon]